MHKLLRIARSYMGMKKQQAGDYGLKTRKEEKRQKKAREKEAEERKAQHKRAEARMRPMPGLTHKGRDTEDSPATDHYVEAPEVNVGKGTGSDGSHAGTQARPQPQANKHLLKHELNRTLDLKPSGDFGSSEGF